MTVDLAPSQKPMPTKKNEPRNEEGGHAVTVENARAGSQLLAAVKGKLGVFEQIPPYDEDPDVYRDWGDDTVFQAKVGKGECAGP